MRLDLFINLGPVRTAQYDVQEEVDVSETADVEKAVSNLVSLFPDIPADAYDSMMLMAHAYMMSRFPGCRLQDPLCNLYDLHCGGWVAVELLNDR